MGIVLGALLKKPSIFTCLLRGDVCHFQLFMKHIFQWGETPDTRETLITYTGY